MIPVKLSLSGFLSYRDQVTVDFSKFDLACISGQNGAGKSSLLDAITWALFGRARRQDDSVISNGLDKAEVSFEFKYEGDDYRVIRSKQRNKTTMLEFNIMDADENWKVLTEHTINKTEKRIQDILRLDYDTFTNASFFLQGKADQFTQQNPADRKRILSNILGLDIWEEYRERAAERRKDQEQRLSSVEGQLKEIDAELAEESSRRERLQQLESRLDELSDNRITKEKYLEIQLKIAADLEHELRRIKDLEAQLQAARQRRDQRAKQLDERRKEQAVYQTQADHAGEIEVEYKQLQVVRQELDQFVKLEASYNTLQQERGSYLAKIQTEKARLETDRDHLLKRKVEAETAERELISIKRDLALVEPQLEKLTKTVELRDQQKENLELLKQAKAALEVDSQNLQIEHAELVERIDHLEKAHEGYCPLCESPLNPDEREKLIEKLKNQEKTAAERLNDNAARLKANQKELAEVSKDLNQMNGLDQQLRQSQQRLFTMQAKRDTSQQTVFEWQQNYSTKLDEVEQSLAHDNFAVDARQSLVEVDEQIAALGYDPKAHDSARQREASLRISETRMRDLDNARSALGPISRQISELGAELTADEKDISSRQASYDEQRRTYETKAADLPDVIALQEELTQSKLEENQKRLEVGGARQKVEVLKDLKIRREELTADRSNRSQQIARLKTLERAFGKDGVPALLIDQALPEIQEQANTLLARLSNGTMSVSFASQRDYKDSKREDKKETLDILISDPAGMRQYEMFSGGEAFRVNFAIRLALSRVLARRAGARLQTLVIDEGFGSQDADGRQRLIEAINHVRSDFAKIIVITHLEELKDAFPARIEVEKGATGSTVEVMVA